MAHLDELRHDHEPDLIIANAENLRNGSGLSPDLYHAIRRLGIDAVTLGDHVYLQASQSFGARPRETMYPRAASQGLWRWGSPCF
jgi:calcineurin-like phosphoesterase